MLSIVIPVGGGEPRLRCTLLCLAGSLAASAITAEVIVVNDGADPAVNRCTEKVSHETGQYFRIVQTPKRGRSAARNAGVAVTRGSRVLFLDGDVLVEPEALRFHARCEDYAECVIYRGTIKHLPWLILFEDPLTGELTSQATRSLRVAADGQSRLASRKLDRDALECPETLRTSSRSTPFQRDLELWFRTHPTDVLASWIGCTGGHLSMQRSVFESLGGFDEQMGLRWGAEDLELGYRAGQKGIAVRHASEAICYHMDHTADGRGGDHDAALAYFANKHSNEGVLRLLEYFTARCSLADVLESCHVTA